MTRVAWTARLRPDRIDDYITAHTAVWPDVLAAITAAGIRDYSIFLLGDRVIGTYACDDPDESLLLEAAAEVTVRWRAAMRGLFDDDLRHNGVTWLPQIFRLD